MCLRQFRFYRMVSFVITEAGGILQDIEQNCVMDALKWIRFLPPHFENRLEVKRAYSAAHVAMFNSFGQIYARVAVTVICVRVNRVESSKSKIIDV